MFKIHAQIFGTDRDTAYLSVMKANIKNNDAADALKPGKVYSIQFRGEWVPAVCLRRTKHYVIFSAEADGQLYYMTRAFVNETVKPI